MAESTTPEGRLAALAAHLGARKLTVELTPNGLLVTNQNAPGCCPETRHPRDLITCRKRPEDDGTLWLFTSWGEPIAPADQIIDAAVFILGYLGQRTEPLTPEDTEQGRAAR
ncbi:hypothetical protein [Actinomadura roseirufa]|uniref:hypothetical protein n=1 Tax=Actinomadura roseirufa TaxID=2094049 RepID=UPI001041832A|nr:hypothetical protein [Actinomadura roseirufa]